MKHGPIALIDEELPVVVLAPMDNLHEKIALKYTGGEEQGGENHR